MGLWNWIKENAGKIVATGVAAVVTGGASLVVQGVAIGGAFLAGTLIDNDTKKRENENKKLNLAGKAGEAITTQVNGLQNDRNKVVKEAEELIKELQRHKAKLNDPNATPEEKDLAKRMIPIIENQISEKDKKISDIDRKIEDLLKTIPDGSEKSKGGLINLGSMDPQTKLIMGAIIFLIIYFAFIKEKDN